MQRPERATDDAGTPFTVVVIPVDMNLAVKPIFYTSIY
jgi:hypothetical protein